jgi:hypothetical protein
MLGFIALMAWIWVTWWPEDVGETIAKIRKGYDKAMGNPQ